MSFADYGESEAKSIQYCICYKSTFLLDKVCEKNDFVFAILRIYSYTKHLHWRCAGTESSNTTKRHKYVVRQNRRYPQGLISAGILKLGIHYSTAECYMGYRTCATSSYIFLLCYVGRLVRLEFLLHMIHRNSVRCCPV